VADLAGGTFTILLNLISVKENIDPLVRKCDGYDCDSFLMLQDVR